jgi:predicted nucleic-acid-binding protein
VNIAVDTNVLVRAILVDDPMQARAARRLLQDATLIAVPLPCLCELVWILRRGAKLAAADVATAIRALLNAGGDFADGVIVHEGRWLGGETFVSFGRKAVALPSQQGEATRLLS